MKFFHSGTTIVQVKPLTAGPKTRLFSRRKTHPNRAAAGRPRPLMRPSSAPPSSLRQAGRGRLILPRGLASFILNDSPFPSACTTSLYNSPDWLTRFSRKAGPTRHLLARAENRGIQVRIHTPSSRLSHCTHKAANQSRGRPPKRPNYVHFDILLSLFSQLFHRFKK